MGDEGRSEAPCSWNSKLFKFTQSDLLIGEPHLSASVPGAEDYRKRGREGIRDAGEHGRHVHAVEHFERCREIVLEAGSILTVDSRNWLLLWASAPLVHLCHIHLRDFEKALRILDEMSDLFRERGDKHLWKFSRYAYHLIKYDCCRDFLRRTQAAPSTPPSQALVRGFLDAEFQASTKRIKEGTSILFFQEHIKVRWRPEEVDEFHGLMTKFVFNFKSDVPFRALADNDETRCWISAQLYEAFMAEGKYELALKMIQDFNQYRKCPGTEWHDGYRLEIDLCRRLRDSEKAVKLFDDHGGEGYLNSDPSTLETGVVVSILLLEQRADLARLMYECYEDMQRRASRDKEAAEKELFKAKFNSKTYYALKYKVAVAERRRKKFADAFVKVAEVECRLRSTEYGALRDAQIFSLDLKSAMEAVRLKKPGSLSLPAELLAEVKKGLKNVERIQAESTVFEEKDTLKGCEAGLRFLLGCHYRQEFLNGLRFFQGGIEFLCTPEAVCYFEEAEAHLTKSETLQPYYRDSAYRDSALPACSRLAFLYGNMITYMPPYRSEAAFDLYQLYGNWHEKFEVYAKKALILHGQALFQREKNYSESWVSTVDGDGVAVLYTALQRLLYEVITDAKRCGDEERVAQKSREALLWAERARSRALMYQIGFHETLRQSDFLKFDKDDDHAWEMITSSRHRSGINTVLVEYGKSRNDDPFAFLVYVVTQKDEVFMEKITARPDLSEKLDKFRENCLPSEEYKREIHQILADWHTSFIKPIEMHLPKDDPGCKVIFALCELLTMVPFGALYDPSRAKNRYLIQRHTIGFTPSFRVLDWCQRRLKELQGKTLVSGKGAIVAVGDVVYEGTKFRNLPGSVKEVEYIKKLFTTSVKKLLKAKATPTNVLFWAKLPANDDQSQALFHIATHAVVDSKFNKGALILSSASDQGGGIVRYLQATPSNPDLFRMELTHHISDLCNWLEHINNPGVGKNLVEYFSSEAIINCGFQWRAQIVVLSACSTAKGEIKSEGVLNLPRALMLGGIPCVVVSQVDVGDAATSALMRRFYKALVGVGQLPADLDVTAALRLAICKMIDKGKWDVRDWAAFSVMGSPSASIPDSLKDGLRESNATGDDLLKALRLSETGDLNTGIDENLQVCTDELLACLRLSECGGMDSRMEGGALDILKNGSISSNVADVETSPEASVSGEALEHLYERSLGERLRPSTSASTAAKAPNLPRQFCSVEDSKGKGEALAEV